MSSHDIIDASILNQVALRRYIRREVGLMLKLYEDFDRKLARLLRRRYRKGLTFGSEAHKSLVKEIRELRASLLSETNSRSRRAASKVAPVEHDREWSVLATALGLPADEEPKRLRTSEALSQPFSSGASSASTLPDWIKALRASDLKRILDSLSLSLSQGVDTDEVVARVIGTKKNQFRDGVAARSRHNVIALVTTLIAHVSDAVRGSIWLQTPALVGEIWISVLDTVTSVICRARDHQVTMFGDNPAPKGAVLLDPPGARPPAHPRCRSHKAPLRRGALPTRRTYNDWLRDQSTKVQNDILGKAKGEMFRRGDVALDGFVDLSGKEFTIEQLANS